MESLADKLRSLGVDLGEKGIQNETEGNVYKNEGIETYVDGVEIENNLGRCFLVTTDYSITESWGDYPIYASVEHRTLLRAAKLDAAQENPLAQMIFMDTETTGLAGGTGTIAFMVGLGFYTEDKFRVYQYFLRTPEDESAMLAAISEVMEGEGKKIVVSFNGKSFDVPLLNTRYVLNGIDSPFAGCQQIDLLHIARRLWKKRLPSRTLGFLENEILGFYRSEEEVPGWMCPELYYSYLREQKAEGVSHVFYHNAVDIVSLGVLELHMAQLLNDPLKSEGIHKLDQLSIGKLFYDMGDVEKALELYETAIDESLPENFYVNALMEYAGILKRRGNWQKAIGLWEKAAEQDCLNACEELAKYYEHQEKSYEMALPWVNRGFEILEKFPKHHYQTQQLTDSYQHRLERVLGKWRKNNGG